MNGISELFELKQIAFFNKNNEDLVVSLEANLEELFFGTSKGKIVRFNLENHELIKPASLALPVNPIKQLITLPNDNLLLAVHDKTLVHVLRNTLMPVAATGQGTIELVSINRRVKSSEIILFALATNKKQILICKGVPTDKGLNLEIIEKIATSSNVTKLCFDGKSICYSTSTKYYVFDMTSQPRIHHELVSLNEGSKALIACVGQDEFAICANDGLIVFIRMDGTSSFRPPLDLNLKVEDMLFVNPVLYVIGATKLIAFNIHDQSMKITIPSNNLHLLTCCSNKIVMVTNEKRVFELVLIDDFGDKIKTALKSNINDGLQLIQSVNSIFPNDNEIIGLCNDILLEECLDLLNNSNFEQGLELFLQTNSDPTLILTRISKINIIQSSNLDKWNVDLSVVETFLEKLLHYEKFLKYSQIIKSYLIRAKILFDSLDFNEIDESLIDDEDLKQWLLENNFHVLLAEYFEYGHIGEAMNVWKLYIENSNPKEEDLEPLSNRLIEIAKKPNENATILKEMLTFLIPKMPELSMSIVQQMENVDLDWLSQNFQSHSYLLLRYLESHESQNDSTFNVHLAKAYVNVLNESVNECKIRSSFRRFLTTIPFCDEISNIIPKEFAIEKLLYSTTLEDIEEVIQKLVIKDLDAAEILYVKFSGQRPHLIKFLIPEYINREDQSGKMQERLLHLLCQIRPFNGIEQIISDLPASYLTRDMILLFQNTVKEYDQCRSNLCLRLAIDKLIKEKEIDNKLKHQFTSIRCGARDRCDLCNELLEHESISFLHNKAVHSRCLRKI